MKVDLIGDLVARARVAEAESWGEAQLTLWAASEHSLVELGVESLLVLDAPPSLLARGPDGRPLDHENLDPDGIQPVYDAAQRLVARLRGDDLPQGFDHGV